MSDAADQLLFDRIYDVIEDGSDLTHEHVAEQILQHAMQYREGCVKAERSRCLDEVERNLRKILADDRADQTHTIRDVLTVLVENALPKWRSP